MAKWEQLVAARERKHLSQLEAAERVNVGLVTYQRWEAGKTKPQPQHMRHLYEVFETLLEQRGETFSQEMFSGCISSAPITGDPGEKMSVVLLAEETDTPQAFITAHMTTRFWSLAFQDHPTCNDKRGSIRQAIKEFDSMNMNDKNYQITRREALYSLAVLPMITLGLTSPEKAVPSTQYGNALAQCAASVEACWELRKSDDPNDRVLAFQCATKYFLTMKTVAQNSSQYRENALDLAVRYALIKAFLARHCVGLSEAILYGKEAVAISKETEDISLQLSAHLNLAWSYFYDRRSSLALAVSQEAENHFLQYANNQQLHPCIQGKIYSTLAIMRAKNGLSPEAALGKAIETNPGDESFAFVDFKHSNLLLDAGWAYCYQGNQTKAMEILEQRVHGETLVPKIAQSVMGRVETINVMALSSLRAKTRDMEKTLHLWISGMDGAIKLQSQQRFNEALANYELMEVVWPGEQRIADLREHVVHWAE